jgi:adenosylcobinamide-GDP ribazoletransferase
VTPGDAVARPGPTTGGGARQALAFLTPIGGAAAPSSAALAWFPVVGLGIGAALGGTWWAGGEIWAPGIVAAVVVTADLAFTGMLHLDGLVDSADGLLPHLPRERRLEVMRQPDAGAFGVGAAVCLLLLRWATIASLLPAPALLAGLWCVSRTAMAVAAARLPYARPGGGLASAFRPARPGFAAAAIGATGLALGSAAAGAWDVPAGPAAVGACAVGAVAVLALAHRRIGGFTGDVLGAAGLVGETCGLLVAAARW